MEKKSILLVDDDALVRELVRDALRGREYNVFEASNYSETLHHLKNTFQLALIDYSLPQHDGLDVLKAVREKHPSLPAVLMTGYGSESVAVRALRAGVNDYVKKPFSLGSLVNRVSEILGECNDENHQPETVESREEFIMDGAAAYIEANHAAELSLDKLAAWTGMNKYKFCRLFKERHKCGFVAFLNRVRIKTAVDLLKNPNLGITDIAFSVGYGTIQHFERVFVKQQGFSPRGYRQKLKHNRLAYAGRNKPLTCRNPS